MEPVLLQRLQADVGLLHLLLGVGAALDLGEALALEGDHLVVQVADQLLRRLQRSRTGRRQRRATTAVLNCSTVTKRYQRVDISVCELSECSRA